MKRNWIIITSLLFCTHLLIGEEIKSKKVHFIGVKLGYHFSYEKGKKTFSATHYNEYMVLRGPIFVDIFYSVNPWKGIGGDLEVGYKIFHISATYHEETTINTEYDSITYDITQNTINVDLLLRYGFEKIEGPGISYIGIGGKTAIRGTPTFKDTYNPLHTVTDEEMKTTWLVHLFSNNPDFW